MDPIAQRAEGFRKIAVATRWAVAGGLVLAGVVAGAAANVLPFGDSGVQSGKTAVNRRVEGERYSDLWNDGGSQYGDLSGLAPPPAAPGYSSGAPRIISGGS